MDLLDNLSFIHPINEFKILHPIKEVYKIICLAFIILINQIGCVLAETLLQSQSFISSQEPVWFALQMTSSVQNLWSNFDYEGELALQSEERKCKNVSTKESPEYIAGYFVLNDVSARDVQFIDKQYTRAKGFDTFGPCGPWLATVDEIIDPCNLHVTTKVNGDMRQDLSTANLVLKVNEIISKLSKVMTLEPGDLVSAGTPTGTALSFHQISSTLKHNDIVEVEIEKLKIRNRVRVID
jgi:2-keto-4-pentenoate hydratase/2-oxohepta-3-ene-1,7-dioic acid hydratase in catechol pathway